jgi:putative aldouronate transport system substrate-binding protein
MPDDMYTGEGYASRLIMEGRKYDIGIAPKEVYPPVYANNEKASDIATLKTALNSFVQDSCTRFITGELSLEYDWESYVDELEEIGLSHYLELCGEAYRAQYGKIGEKLILPDF